MNAAIILSGGIGSRVGANIPKQYIEVEGKSILEYSLRNFIVSDSIDIIVIVLASQWLEYVNNLVSIHTSNSKKIMFAQSGDTRQLSIFNGLKVLQESKLDIDRVIIHDAARPFVSKKLIEGCLSGLVGDFDGVLPVIPVKDTVYYSTDNNKIDRLLDRSKLFAGQAPEAFKFMPYLNAHYNMSEEDIKKVNGSSELAYLSGMKIKMIPGDPENYKITDSSDLDRFKSSLR